MTDRVPTVRVTLGDEVVDVARRSTYDLTLKLQTIGGVDLVTVTDPVALAYDGAGRTVVFPEGRFLALDVDAGGVVAVTASPHRSALVLRDALILARELGEQLEHHGWTRSASGDASYGGVEAAARADATGFFQSDVGRWQAGDDEVTIGLRQVHSAADGADGRRYLVSVEFANARILQNRARAFGRLRNQLPPA